MYEIYIGGPLGLQDGYLTKQYKESVQCTVGIHLHF